MTATTSPVVLLIPGFFGYNAFGPETAPLLEYFAGVKEILEPRLPNFAVLVHEPPPTGSLDERVASLHEAVWKLRHGRPLPHANETVHAERVHLIGHSTGGLDARLLANPKFRWVGGPVGAERIETIDAIGEIVTICAPFGGTPLVRHVRLVRDAVLGLVQVLTLLGSSRHGELHSVLRQLLGAGAASLSRSRLPGAAPSAVVAHAARRAVLGRGASAEDADQVAHQVGQFLRQIQEDRQLFDDLSLEHMEALNETIAGGDDLSHIHSYVTVSPEPSLADIGSDVLGRFVYRTLYAATAQSPMKRREPAGSILGPRERVEELLRDDVSCDGVVPTRSQTLDGAAAGIVLADHLDVVGSFHGGSGADVMRSRSNFTRGDFVDLWTDVAGIIA